MKPAAVQALDNAAMKDLIAKNCRAGAETRGGAVPGPDACAATAPVLRKCVGLSRATWYRPPLDWTVRDAEVIAALAGLAEDRPSRGFWKCRKHLSDARRVPAKKQQKTPLLAGFL